MALIKDQKILLGQYEVTTDFRELTFTLGVEPQDNTRLNGNTRVTTPGLKTVSLSGTGYFAADGTSAIDDILNSLYGASDTPASVPAVDGTEGTRAYFARLMETEYVPISGAVGDNHNIAFAATGSGGVVVAAGRIEHALGNTTANSASTGSQLGALSATQKLWSVLHVVSASGTSPTLDVLVESDDNSGFTSAATEITHTQATAATSEFSSVAGAVTNDYWRISWTIGGSDTPTFSFLCAIGIV